MRARRIAILGLGAAVIVVLGLAWVVPSMDHFRSENPFWNGLSELNSRFHPFEVSDSARLMDLVLKPSESTVLVLGPSEPFREEDVDAVRAFLEAGGLVVLAEDFGVGNSLLEGLGVEARFSGMVLLDPLFKDRDSRMPRMIDFTASPYTRGLSALTLNYATALADVGDGVRVLARSTAFSYLSEDLRAAPEEAELVGPLPVMAEVGYGGGSLVLISDSSLFINSMLDRGDNDALLRNLVDGRVVYVDVSHWSPSLLTQFKAVLARVYEVAGVTEVKYALVGVLAIVIFKVKWRGKEMREERDEVEDALREHPEWDRALLERLKSLRDEHGVR